jgi:hypothetical protein
MGTFTRAACCVLWLLPLAACDQGKGNVDLDHLRLDASRLGRLVDGSTAGLDAQGARGQEAHDADAAKRLEIDRALRDAGLKVLILRNRLLYEDVIGEREARATHWPAWILQPPESSLSPVDLEERYEWLRAQVQSLAEPGCRIARDKQGDAAICGEQ